MKKLIKFLTILFLLSLAPIYFVKHFIESRRYDRKLRKRYLQGKRAFDSANSESFISQPEISSRSEIDPILAKMRASADGMRAIQKKYFGTTFEELYGKTNN